MPACIVLLPNQLSKKSIFTERIFYSHMRKKSFLSAFPLDSHHNIFKPLNFNIVIHVRMALCHADFLFPICSTLGQTRAVDKVFFRKSIYYIWIVYD